MTGRRAGALAVPPCTRRRLAVFLAASIGLHLFALGLYQPVPARSAPWPDTPLLWVDLEPPPARDLPGPKAAHPAAKSRRAYAGSPSVAKPAAPDTTEAETPSAVPTADLLISAPTTRQGSLPSAGILELAREIARQSSSVTMPPEQPALPEERAILPGLDRALRRNTPGERRYADGMIKMVTPSGRAYCLKPPPEFARGGPAEALAVPTNCP